MEENNLTVTMSALRRALGESAEQKYVETLPKRGYRFVAPVREVQDEDADVMLVRHSRAQVVVEEEETEEAADC